MFLYVDNQCRTHQFIICNFDLKTKQVVGWMVEWSTDNTEIVR